MTSVNFGDYEKDIIAQVEETISWLVDHGYISMTWDSKEKTIVYYMTEEQRKKSLPDSFE
mgnify:CR=1 FL=1